MVKKTTENCAELGLKLDALYAHFKLHTSLTPRVTGPTALAKALGLSRSTIDRWCRKVEDANREAFQVAPHHILLLADLLCTILPARLSQGEAARLWRFATATEFKRRLSAVESVSIGGLLDRRPSLLVVKAGVVPQGLNMVEVDLDPVDGELELQSRQSFAISAKARKGRTLVVLGEGPNGWSLLAPAPEFAGDVVRSPQRIPTAPKDWSISQTSGPHRIVVIELDAKSAPVERKRGQTLALLPEQERALVEELLDPARSGDWRWGEAALFVHKAKNVV